MEPIIKTENVKVIYNKGKDNEFVALNDISIEVFPQEYLIFFGPSGCGKSTMLYTILGLQTPSEGKVYINGRDRATFTEEEDSKATSGFFGMVFQNFNLIYSLNVLDNVVLPQVFTDQTKEDRTEKAMKVLKRFGIENRIKNFAGNLSGGQQQRVAICRALINDPTVLLADEPVGNLDSESAEVVMATLKDINMTDKKTVILVTHDARYLHYADRVYYFKDAKIERVVRNRRRTSEEPGKESDQADFLMNELERLAMAHDFMNVSQLKAWSLTNYLTEELTVNQLERLEALMEDLLSGKINEHQFFERANLAYGEGGVGLYKATAVKYVLKISQILRAIKGYKEISKNLSGPEQKQKVVDLLRKFLISDYTGDLKPTQLERLDKVIYNRVYGVSNIGELNQFLDWPLSEGGVWLNTKTAEHLAQKLETILAQLYSK